MPTLTEPLITENDTEITVHLKPPLPETRTRHLRAFVQAMVCRTRLMQLLAASIFLPFLHLLVYLVIVDRAVKTLHLCVQYVLLLIVIQIFPMYLYNTLVLPNDYTLTLSVTTGHMFLTRFGCTKPSLVFPLTKIFDFRSVGEDSHVTFNFRCTPNVIQADTTEHPIFLGESTHSYHTVATRLNNFLQQHREQGDIPPPQMVFPSDTNHRARVNLPALNDLPASPRSRLTFHRLTPTSFKCVKNNPFDGSGVLGSITVRLLYNNSPFRYMFQRPEAELCSKYNLKFRILCEVISSAPLALYTLLSVKRPSPTWIFTDNLVEHSSLRQWFYFFISRTHVQIKSDYKIKVIPYQHRPVPERNPIFRTVRSEPTTLYRIGFSSTGTVLCPADGFSHDEAVCMLVWLKEHFPHLFLFDTEDTAAQQDEHEAGVAQERDIGGDVERVQEPKAAQDIARDKGDPT